MSVVDKLDIEAHEGESELSDRLGRLVSGLPSMSGPEEAMDGSSKAPRSPEPGKPGTGKRRRRRGRFTRRGRGTSALLVAVLVAGLVAGASAPRANAATYTGPDVPKTIAEWRAASSAAGADLVVSSISNPPASGFRGTFFSGTDTVKNQGNLAAGPSVTRYYLSLNKTKGSSDVLLGSRPAQGLGPGKSSKAAGGLNLEIPDSMNPGRYHLLGCADGAKKVKESSEANNCRSSAKRIQVKATSEDLIDEALAKGDIDEETALTYRVFASVGDGRLPKRFRGDDSQTDSGALGEVAIAWETLSTETQGTLGPFLIPPYHEGSHWAGDAAQGTVQPATDQADDPERPWCVGSPALLLQDWSYVDTADGKVRVWWQERYEGTDHDLADVIKDEVEKKIWPALTGLMREPKSDGGSTKSCGGGSDATDIALLDFLFSDSRGEAWHGLGCSDTSGYIYLNRDKVRMPTVAHELMHVIQFSYDVSGCLDYRWLMEATAKWSEDYVSDPRYGFGVLPDDYEQPFAEEFLNHPKVSLEERDPGHHEYGAYLLPFFLARQHDDPQVVRRMFENAGSMGSLAAVDAAIKSGGGGFIDQWDDFVLYNWNRGEVNFYADWDHGLLEGLGAVPDTAYSNAPEEILLGGLAEKTVQLDTAVDHLAARYKWYGFSDENIELIEFTNQFGPRDPGTSVQAIITLADGSELVEDWTNLGTQSFCRDRPREDLQELVLIFGNGSMETDVDDDDSKLVVKDECEPLPNRWVGTSSGMQTDTATGFAQTWSGTATFQKQERRGKWQDYQLVGGTVTWGMSGGGTIGCTITGTSPTVNLTPATEDEILTGSKRLSLERKPKEGKPRLYNASITQDVPLITVTITCTGGDPVESQWGAVPFWLDTFGDKEAPQNATTLSGSASNPDFTGGNPISWQWNLSAE